MLEQLFDGLFDEPPEKPFNTITYLVIPNGVTFIEDEAYRDNGLTSVTIPDSVTEISGGAFNNPLDEASAAAF